MKTGNQWAWFGLFAVVLACGSTTENRGTPSNHAAGNAGAAPTATAGEAAAGGSAPTTMAGNAGAIGNDEGVCRRDLREFCSARGRCPESSDDVEGFCSYAQSAVRMKSSCGGTSLRVTAGLGVSVWHFDAAGKLIGAIVTGDTGNACFNGATTFYGELCVLEGDSQDICPPQGDKPNGAAGHGSDEGGAGGAANITAGGAGGAP